MKDIRHDFSARWALLPMRLVVGFGFLAHGLAKFNRGPEKFAGLLTYLHVPLPLVAAWTTTGVEIVGGAALMIGAFVALASVPLVITMLVAMFTVHIHHGFSAVNTIGLTADGPQFGPPGYEISLLYIGILVGLALAPPTAFSIDAARRARR